MSHYKIFDLQMKDNAFGRATFQTKEMARDQIIDFCSPDMTEDDIKSIVNKNADEVADLFDFEIIKITN